MSIMDDIGVEFEPEIEEPYSHDRYVVAVPESVAILSAMYMYLINSRKLHCIFPSGFFETVLEH